MSAFAVKPERPEPDQRYTYADYQTWPDSERWELIDGRAYMMSPSPSRGHQDLIGELHYILREFLKGKPCKPVLSPYDVKLDNSTVVQPDITVWCTRNMETQNPDEPSDEELTVVIEVLSPSSASYDLIKKQALYENQGVPEYWVVAPDEKSLIRFSLREGKYAAEYYEKGEFTSDKLAGFSFDVEEFFKSAAE